MDNMKRVILTGATSMIGVSVIECLLKGGVEKIYAIVRPNSTKLNRIPKSDRVDVILCEIDDYLKLSEVINSKCDVFYHFAWKGAGRFEERNGSLDVQCSNIQYTLDSIKAADKCGCRTFVGAGSQAEFGIHDMDAITPNTAVDPVQPYGIAKYTAGKMVREYARNHNMNCFWVRIFSCYGFHDSDSTLVKSTIMKLLDGQKPSFTPAEQRWDYLNSADAAKALCLIGNQTRGNKVYCLGSGKARSLREYIEDIRDAIDLKLELGIGDIPYPEGVVMNICASISDITKDTNWVPEIEFSEGIKEIVQLLSKKK